jgi:prolyl 4-hydroxylase
MLVSSGKKVDESIAFEFMRAAVSGASKTQTIRHFKKYYDCTDEDIQELIKVCFFKDKPKTLDYRQVANQLNNVGVNWFPFPFTQIGTVENFLSRGECEALMEVADENLRPSVVSTEQDDNKISKYRTSQTADLNYLSSPGLNLLDKKICSFMNITPFYGEVVQSQKYKPGQYYKEHYDYFTPITKEYKTYTEWMGQRTWTFMCYLNDVEEGGETSFRFLNLKIKPKQGMAVVWNNLYRNGLPNPKTLHEALPPISGDKYILTKWFRSWSLI